MVSSATIRLFTVRQVCKATVFSSCLGSGRQRKQGFGARCFGFLWQVGYVLVRVVADSLGILRQVRRVGDSSSRVWFHTLWQVRYVWDRSG